VLITIAFKHGSVAYARADISKVPGVTLDNRQIQPSTAPFGWRLDKSQIKSVNQNFLWDSTSSYSIAQAPYWSIVVPTALLAGLPWLSRRFSLRTLLVATTLVAAVLGLIVWLR
jgi:hypothetical protein